MDANASIQMASAVASAYAQSATPKAPAKANAPQNPKPARPEDRYEPSVENSSKETATSTVSAKTNVANTVKNTTDRLELSGSSQDLQPAAARSKTLDTRPEPKPEDPDEASQWSQDRLARLDHLALLVKEGHYRIEPFMVDEIALRLARAMASI